MFKGTVESSVRCSVGCMITIPLHTQVEINSYLNLKPRVIPNVRDSNMLYTVRHRDSYRGKIRYLAVAL